MQVRNLTFELLHASLQGLRLRGKRLSAGGMVASLCLCFGDAGLKLSVLLATLGDLSFLFSRFLEGSSGSGCGGGGSRGGGLSLSNGIVSFCLRLLKLCFDSLKFAVQYGLLGL